MKPASGMATSAVASPTLEVVPTVSEERMPSAGADHPLTFLIAAAAQRASARAKVPASVTARNGKVKTNINTTGPGGVVTIHQIPAAILTTASTRPTSPTKDLDLPTAVSYTHLTLPTISSV